MLKKAIMFEPRSAAEVLDLVTRPTCSTLRLGNHSGSWTHGNNEINFQWWWTRSDAACRNWWTGSDVDVADSDHHHARKSCTLSFDRFTGGCTLSQLQEITRAVAARQEQRGAGGVIINTIKLSRAPLRRSLDSVKTIASIISCFDSLENLEIDNLSLTAAGFELTRPLPAPATVDEFLLGAARNPRSRLRSIKMSAAAGTRAFVEFCVRFADTLESFELKSDIALLSSSSSSSPPPFAYAVAVGLSSLTRIQKVTLHCHDPHVSLLLPCLKAPSIQEVMLFLYPYPIDSDLDGDDEDRERRQIELNIAQDIKILLSCSPYLKTLHLMLRPKSDQAGHGNRLNALSFLSGARVTPSLQNLELEGFRVSLSTTSNDYDGNDDDDDLDDSLSRTVEWEPAFRNTTLQNLRLFCCDVDPSSLGFFSSFQGLRNAQFIRCQGQGMVHPSHHHMHSFLQNSPILRSFKLCTYYDRDTSNTLLEDVAHFLEERNSSNNNDSSFVDSIEYDLGGPNDDDNDDNNDGGGNHNHNNMTAGRQAVYIPAIADVVRHSRGSLVLRFDSWLNANFIAEGLRLNNDKNNGRLKNFQLTLSSFHSTTNDLMLLLEAAKEAQSLESLHLAVCNYNDSEDRLVCPTVILVDDHCAALICELFKSTSFKKLVLGDCGLHCDSLAMILEGLHSRQQHICLGFENCWFELGFFKLLGSALPNLGCLQELSFSTDWHSLDDFVPFLEYLPDMGHLKVLQFDAQVMACSSSSTADTATAASTCNLLVAGVEHNTSLTHIHGLTSEGDVATAALERVEFYLKLNRYGRYILSLPTTLAPTSLWPYLLANIAKDDDDDVFQFLYYFLKAKPSLIDELGHKNKNILPGGSGRGRKRGSSSLEQQVE